MPVTHPYDKPKNLEFAVASISAIIFIAGMGASYIHSKFRQMTRPHVYQENVVAGPEPESYCVVDGRKAYLTIDGLGIENKLQGQNGGQ